MNGCAVHISDLHDGKGPSPALVDALQDLVAELRPELVIASGDLANRGRVDELRRARALLDSLDAPTLAVPGNHDIPYTFPGRFTHPWRAFTQVLGGTNPIFSSEALVAAGLNSVRPWRHQGGRLRPQDVEPAAAAFEDAPAGALRLAVLHHHLAGAPWRTSRKFPLKHRDRALNVLAAAGAELVVSGHIHQSSVVERHEFETDCEAALVLATAPGFERPRPHRRGEAQGLHVYYWDGVELTVETRIWDGAAWAPSARRTFLR